MGALVLLLATTVVVCSALSVARRIGDRPGRVQQLSTTVVVIHGLLIVPTYLLGLFDAVTAVSVGLVVVGLAFGLLGLVAVQEGGLAGFRAASVEQARGLWSLGPQLWRAMRRADFPLWVVVIVAGALFLWLFFVVFVSPPRGNSDAFFYHEPIVAFMIQHRGLDPIELPANLQRINGFPRFCHIVQLWFALFTGRELTELPNVLSYPFVVAAIYGLARKVGTQKTAAIAWAFCFPLLPGVLRLTDTIMVDVHSAAFVMAACYCVIVPRMTMGSALLAALSVALVMGTKYHLAPVAAALSIILGLRLLARRHEWGLGRAVALTGGAALIVLLGVASVLLRNYLLFENPLYPAGLRIDALGIHWRAPDEIKNAWMSGKRLSPAVVVDKWLTAPFAKKPWGTPSARVEDYGVAPVFLSFPLAVIASFVAAVKAIRRRRRGLPIDGRLWAMLAVGFLLVVCLATFQPPIRGRYYLPVVGLTFVATGWLFRAPRWRRTGRQVAFAAVAMMLVSVAWANDRGWIAEPWRVWDRLQVSAVERDFTSRKLMSVTEEVGRARAEELGAGDVVGFDQGKLIGVFWNDDYSTDVVWLGRGHPLRRADQVGVDWLYLYRRTMRPMRTPLTEKWQWIGKVITGRRGVPPGGMYRRVMPPEAEVGEARPREAKPRGKRE